MSTFILLGSFFFLHFGVVVFFSLRVDGGEFGLFLLTVGRQIVLWFGYSTFRLRRETLEFRMILTER